MERFASISDQIISCANKSEKEKDGRTLIQVIRLVFAIFLMPHLPLKSGLKVSALRWLD